MFGIGIDRARPSGYAVKVFRPWRTLFVAIGARRFEPVKTDRRRGKNTQDAIEEWLDAARQRKIPIPAPNSASKRERAKKAHLAAQLKQLADGVDQFEERLHALEKVARDIEEKISSEQFGAFRRDLHIVAAFVHPPHSKGSSQRIADPPCGFNGEDGLCG
jgi:hypothetical protein